MRRFGCDPRGRKMPDDLEAYQGGRLLRSLKLEPASSVPAGNERIAKVKGDPVTAVKRRWTQTALASRLGSSQSRVAKVEAGDATVSLDLQVRALLALGGGPRDVAKALKDVEVPASA